MIIIVINSFLYLDIIAVYQGNITSNSNFSIYAPALIHLLMHALTSFIFIFNPFTGKLFLDSRG